MKKLMTLTAIVLAMVFTNEITAQEFSGLDKSPADIASYPPGGRDSNKKIKVVYSRPQLKGRSLADLAPAGKVWRTGANEATEITFYQDVKVGGKDLKAGSYALFTIPNKDNWTIIFNNNLNQWGAFSYDDAADEVRIEAKASSGSEALEAFSIAFTDADNGANMVLGWGTSRVTVPITLGM